MAMFNGYVKLPEDNPNVPKHQPIISEIVEPMW